MSSVLKKSQVQTRLDTFMRGAGALVQKVGGVGRAYIRDAEDVSPFAIFQIDLRSNVLCLSAFLGLRLGKNDGLPFSLGSTLNIENFDKLHHRLIDGNVDNYISEFSRSTWTELKGVPASKAELLQAIREGAIGPFSISSVAASLGENSQYKLEKVAMWAESKDVEFLGFDDMA